MTTADSTEQLPAAAITITQAMIDAYAEISGDFNPLHVDEQAARATPFGGTIAHGCIPLEPIFQSIRRWAGRPDLPQATTMKLRYHRPSRPGDTIRVDARVIGQGARDGRSFTQIGFTCLNQRDEAVLDGECEVPDAR